MPFEIYRENLQDTHTELASRSDAPAKEPDESEQLLAMTASLTPIGLQSHAMNHDAMDIDNLNSPAADAKNAENLESSPADQEQCTVINSAAAAENSSTTTAVQDLTHEQEGKLVRSALRSSLDGEDAELLNDFLSKAKAKRAAKAALADSQDTEPEESPEESSTPRSRRALEDIDTNSPTPIKVQTSSSKGDHTAAEEAREDTVSKDQDDEPAPASPASPACRRSTRVKAPPANAPAVRNTISLRRAKGNEFIFLQRTEAQELALATKRNTRKNRGNSVFPKVALQAMAERDEKPATGDVDREEQVDHQGSSSRRSVAVQKHVSWKEERLVEYEDDESPSQGEAEAKEGDSKTSSVPVIRSASKRSDTKAAASRSTRSSRSQVTSGEAQEASSTSTTATPRSRRVRRLGDSTTGVSGTPVKTGSGRISKPPAASAPAAGPSTPTKGRRKLVPKSPSSSLLPAPSSKAEQPFVSGIPTRSASSAGGSSEGTKRKSMIQASAGCTPMPRRVRART